MKENSNAEIDKIIEEITYVIQRKKDPFEVNVAELLNKLNQIFKKIRTIEELSKDAEAMDHIATVVKEQAGLLYERTSSLFISPKRLAEKLEKFSVYEFSRLIELCLHPVASTNFINSDSIKSGYEYWFAKNPIKIEKKSYETEIGFISANDIYVQDKNFIKELEEFETDLMKKLPLNLTKEMENMNAKERVRFLYFISFLIAQGKLHVSESNEEILIEKGPSKRNYSIIFRLKT
jgi:hypothetical protein